MPKKIASKTLLQDAPQLHDINTEPETAKYLKVSTRFLLRLRHDGKIQFAKFGAGIRYTRQHIMNYVNGNQHTQQE